jgi:segregation and condensation protein B
MMLKGQIEAALFLTGKPIHASDLASLLGSTTDDVELALGELIQDYAFRPDSALEIDDSDGYILQVKDDYMAVVNKMLPLDISTGALRTLSAIAIKAPLKQSVLIDLRGQSAYDHIHELLEKRLINKKREGRSFILNTTRHFHEYFKLMGDKSDLLKMVQLASFKENLESLPPPLRPVAADHVENGSQE